MLHFIHGDDIYFTHAVLFPISSDDVIETCLFEFLAEILFKDTAGVGLVVRFRVWKLRPDETLRQIHNRNTTSWVVGWRNKIERWIHYCLSKRFDYTCKHCNNMPNKTDMSLHNVVILCIFAMALMCGVFPLSVTMQGAMLRRCKVNGWLGQEFHDFKQNTAATDWSL